LDPRKPFSVGFSTDLIAVTLNLERMILDQQELSDAQLALSYRVSSGGGDERIVLELAAQPRLLVSRPQKQGVPAEVVERFRAAARSELFSALKNRVVLDELAWSANTWTLRLTRVKLSEGWLVLSAEGGEPPSDAASSEQPSPEAGAQPEHRAAASSQSSTSLADASTDRNPPNRNLPNRSL
jgi:hypothetical protein